MAQSAGKAMAVSSSPVITPKSIGVVKEVKLVSKEPLYYNVALTVSPTSEVAMWYNTPGQYADLILVKSVHHKANSFFIASPPSESLEQLEFLIQDVSNTVANEIINSKPGEQVSITTSSYSTGFDLGKLSPIKESQSILMFACGYGLGPFRALIEKGFEADKRMDAILYAMYTPGQAPYTDSYSAWEQTGVKVQLGSPVIVSTISANTVVLIIASVEEQKTLTKHFEDKGVPKDKILTIFDGIPSEQSYHNKVVCKTTELSYHSKVFQTFNHYPNFLHHSAKHVPVELKL